MDMDLTKIRLVNIVVYVTQFLNSWSTVRMILSQHALIKNKYFQKNKNSHAKPPLNNTN